MLFQLIGPANLFLSIKILAAGVVRRCFYVAEMWSSHDFLPVEDNTQVSTAQ